MLEIWYIRHGQTDWNVQQRWQGQTDLPLNELGLFQARCLARRLQTIEFDAVFCSDLDRTRTTARIALPGVTPRFDPRLREMHFGGFEGKSWIDMDEEDRAQLEAWRKDPYGLRLAGGESFSDVEERLLAWRGELPPSGRILAFTHGGNIRNALWNVLGHPKDQLWAVTLDNTGITRIIHEERRVNVLSVNDCAHLEPVYHPPDPV